MTKEIESSAPLDESKPPVLQVRLPGFITDEKTESSALPDESKPPALQARLPGFITDEEIGLGDVIKQATSYIGIKPCGGCEQRAAALNRWMIFTHGHPKQRNS